MKSLELIKNNSSVDFTDLEWIDALFQFLQGNKAFDSNYSLENGMTKDDAWSVIYFLQEYFPLLPDRIEKCCKCDDLFDTYYGGEHFDLEGANYCDSCENESEATFCYDCGEEIWKEGTEYDNGHYCTGCRTKKIEEP